MPEELTQSELFFAIRARDRLKEAQDPRWIDVDRYVRRSVAARLKVTREAQPKTEEPGLLGGAVSRVGQNLTGFFTQPFADPMGSQAAKAMAEQTFGPDGAAKFWLGPESPLQRGAGGEVGRGRLAEVAKPLGSQVLGDIATAELGRRLLPSGRAAKPGERLGALDAARQVEGIQRVLKTLPGRKYRPPILTSRLPGAIGGVVSRLAEPAKDALSRATTSAVSGQASNLNLLGRALGVGEARSGFLEAAEPAIKLIDEQTRQLEPVKNLEQLHGAVPEIKKSLWSAYNDKYLKPIENLMASPEEMQALADDVSMGLDSRTVERNPQALDSAIKVYKVYREHPMSLRVIEERLQSANHDLYHRRGEMAYWEYDQILVERNALAKFLYGKLGTIYGEEAVAARKNYGAVAEIQQDVNRAWNRRQVSRAPEASLSITGKRVKPTGPFVTEDSLIEYIFSRQRARSRGMVEPDIKPTAAKALSAPVDLAPGVGAAPAPAGGISYSIGGKTYSLPEDMPVGDRLEALRSHAEQAVAELQAKHGAGKIPADVMGALGREIAKAKDKIKGTARKIPPGVSGSPKAAKQAADRERIAGKRASGELGSEAKGVGTEAAESAAAKAATATRYTDAEEHFRSVFGRYPEGEEMDKIKLGASADEAYNPEYDKDIKDLKSKRNR